MHRPVPGRGPDNEYPQPSGERGDITASTGVNALSIAPKLGRCIPIRLLRVAVVPAASDSQHRGPRRGLPEPCNSSKRESRPVQRIQQLVSLLQRPCLVGRSSTVPGREHQQSKGAVRSQRTAVSLQAFLVSQYGVSGQHILPAELNGNSAVPQAASRETIWPAAAHCRSAAAAAHCCSAVQQLTTQIPRSTKASVWDPPSNGWKFSMAH